MSWQGKGRGLGRGRKGRGRGHIKATITVPRCSHKRQLEPSVTLSFYNLRVSGSLSRQRSRVRAPSSPPDFKGLKSFLACDIKVQKSTKTESCGNRPPWARSQSTARPTEPRRPPRLIIHRSIVLPLNPLALILRGRDGESATWFGRFQPRQTSWRTPIVERNARGLPGMVW